MAMEVSNDKKEVFDGVQARSGDNDIVTGCHAEADWRRSGIRPNLLGRCFT